MEIKKTKCPFLFLDYLYIISPFENINLRLCMFLCTVQYASPEAEFMTISLFIFISSVTTHFLIFSFYVRYTTLLHLPPLRFHSVEGCRAGIFKKFMGARHRGGIGFSYRPARLHRLAEFISWMNEWMNEPFIGFSYTGSHRVGTRIIILRD